VVEALAEARAEVSLERLGALIRRATELRSNFEALAGAIRAKYSSDARISSLVGNVIKALEPQEVSRDRLADISSRLESYVENLERSVKLLTEYAVLLDRLEEGLKRLEREGAELAAWSELLKAAAPHLAAEAAKLAAAAQRLLSQRLFEEGDLRRVVDEVELALREARSHARVCRTAYSNRVNELLSQASQVLKALRKAGGAVQLEEAGRVRALEDRLSGLVARLSEALQRPLEVKLDLAAARAELSQIEEEAAALVERALSGEGEVVAREVERLARSLEGRPLTLSLLLETLSRRTGIPMDALARQLVMLEKRGFLTVHVKLSV